jgi:hypothetical protein
MSGTCIIFTLSPLATCSGSSPAHSHWHSMALITLDEMLPATPAWSYDRVIGSFEIPVAVSFLSPGFCPLVVRYCCTTQLYRYVPYARVAHCHSFSSRSSSAQLIGRVEVIGVFSGPVGSSYIPVVVLLFLYDSSLYV